MYLSYLSEIFQKLSNCYIAQWGSTTKKVITLFFRKQRRKTKIDNHNGLDIIYKVVKTCSNFVIVKIVMEKNVAFILQCVYKIKRKHMTHSYLNEFNTYNIWINSIKYTYFVSFHMKITKTLCTMY